ncbi:MAG: M6 family metalloprotease domain-containing protein, partial [Treponema sp.]|nr:M6 family metalloprotease domain-containing protein [Treponema sp.]
MGLIGRKTGYAFTSRIKARFKFLAFLILIALTAGTAYTRTGNVVGLTVVVDFPDFRNGVTRASIEEWLNGAGRDTVRGYFHEVSGGRLNFTNIVTPVITMDHPKSYYDIDRREQPLSNERIQIFLTEALDKLGRTNIDLSRVTRDGNNRALALSFLISGGGTPAQLMRGLRSHAGTVNRDIAIRGLTFRSYQISDGLGSLNIMPGIKTFVHEVGHSLMGWPDLYNVIDGVSSGRITGARDSGLGAWCLMANYGMAPNPYLRHIAGWIDVTDITSARDGTVFTLNANANTALVYRRNEKEAFYIEARSQSAGMETYMGGIPARSGGLAIWHINADDSIERTGRFPVRLVQADGRNDLQNGASDGDDTDLFRAGVNQHFSSATHPAAVWTDGTPSGLRITGISASGPVMTFTIGDIPRTSANDFLLQVLSYASAQRNIVIELNQDITLNAVVNIPAPRNPEATLTIRSANPARPVTIKRGHSGDLFRTSYGPLGSNGKFTGATLILENIILDGDIANYPDNSTPLVRVDGIFHEYLDRNGRLLEEENEGSTFIMNSGAVLRDNSGSGVVVQSNCVFTMNGGEISGNISNTVIVREVVFATFIMRETHISDSTGGGVNVAGYRSVITINGGRIINNIGGSIRNVVEQNNLTPNVSRIDLNGGVIIGAVTTFNLTSLLVPLISGRHNLNGAVTALWNTPRRGSGSVIDTTVPYYSNGMFHYAEGSVTDLILSAPGAASWGLQNGVSGIVYRIGASAGFVPIAGVNVSGASEAITTMAAFTGQIRAHATTRGDVVINVGRNLTLDTRVVIPAAAPGGRLIIRSANPSSPVTLTRGVTGHLITLSAGANVVLENIIIDGDGGGRFAAAGGVLVRVERDGTLTINDGAIVRNNTNLRLQGSGITVTGTLNMTGGEVSSNITSPSLASSGGVSIDRY